VGDDKPNTSALGKCVMCGVGLALHTLFISFILLLMSGKFSPNRFLDRIASQTIAACAASVAPSISHNHKLTSHHYQQTHVVLSTTRRDLCKLHGLSPDLHPKAAKAQQHNLFQSQRPPPNERTCIGWHKRYASVSGRSSRGIYVPRR
jgi:uncharacterized membrane protein YccC